MSDGLVLRKVAISRGGVPLVSVDTTIAPGEVLTIMGPSGAGKSTLLDFIIGDLAPGFAATGEVWLNGSRLTGPPETRRIGILYQDPLLFPHLSVAANLAFGLPRGRDRARIHEALDAIGLSGFADRDPATLSGGQAARVALMRTLLAEPKALLLDEPFSKLDTERRAQMRSLVFEQARAAAIPVMLVTHDHADAKAAGGPVLTVGTTG